MDLVTAKEMQRMDFLTIESFGIPGRVLMESAGRGATDFFIEKFSSSQKKRVGVLAGKGNNGGDGFVIARYLSQKNFIVTVYLLAKKNGVKGDAEANLKLLAPLDISLVEIVDETVFANCHNSMIHQDIWIDAILGTGLQSDVKGFFKVIIEFINNLKKPVFAVDIPSGLNSETGVPCGICIKADATATFAFAKPGHFLFPGAYYTGELKIVDIGIPAHIAKQVNPKQYLLTTDSICNYVLQRAPDAHKGTSGHLLVISGSTGKTGAAALTATSAMRTGAGLVSVAIPGSLNSIMEGLVLEAMTHPLPESSEGTLGLPSFEKILELLSGKQCLAIGPGLGTDSETKELICSIILKSSVPVVLDADALNSIAENIGILQHLKIPVILTPHPGEMGRLINKTPGEINQDKIGCARDFAVKHKVYLVLKGAKTVIANPAGRVSLNNTGNSGMASGGMGDVLTGIIAGLLTQGYPPEAAACMGVYLHGSAADQLSHLKGPFGFLASDVMTCIPSVLATVVL